MSDEVKTTVEALKQDADVQRELSKTAPGETKKRAPKTRDKLLIGSQVLLLVALAVFATSWIFASSISQLLIVSTSVG